MEQIFSLIKARNVNQFENITKIFKKGNFTIVKQEQICFTKEQAEEFYSDHRDEEYFDELINFMSSGSVVGQILEGENAFFKSKKIMEQIRKEYSEEKFVDIAYSSTSQETFSSKAEFFFNLIGEVNEDCTYDLLNLI